MGFLNKIFKKQDDEISADDIEKVENLVSNKENNSNSKEIYIENTSLDNSFEDDNISENINMDFELEISKIKLNQINKIRNLLDKREIQLTNNIEQNNLVENLSDNNDNNNSNLEDNEVLVGGSKNTSIGEINIEERVSEKDLDDKTYIENSNEIKNNSNMDFIDNSDESDEFVEVNIFEPYDDILNKIKNIFGDENIFFEKDKKSSYENLNYRNIYFIGIRKLDEFNNSKSHWAEENSWFVSNIKKLEELKQFKVLDSKEGLKDLLFDIDNDNSIILSFRSTNLLKDKNFFNFPIK